MRGPCTTFAWAVAFPALASAWPWPWTAKTTTPAPLAMGAFEAGAADALGFTDTSECYNDTKFALEDLWDAAEDYRHGGYVSKAAALARFGFGIKRITDALTPCYATSTTAAKFEKLMGYLEDPRYYSVQNALTISLNVAEDRHQLETFTAAWTKGDFHAAGFDITNTVLDVLEHPAIPGSNGTMDTQIAAGLARGLAHDISNLECFKDLTVEVPAIVCGVVDVATVLHVVSGLESLFHGLQGIVPTFKACLADRKDIMKLLESLGDLVHPSTLAKQVWENMKTNGVDISLEAASAVLAWKGREWERFGVEIGKMLSKVTLGLPGLQHDSELRSRAAMHGSLPSEGAVPTEPTAAEATSATVVV